MYAPKEQRLFTEIQQLTLVGRQSPSNFATIDSVQIDLVTAAHVAVLVPNEHSNLGRRDVV